MKKPIIYLMLFMVLLSIAIAQPPQQAIDSSDTSLIIDYPKIDVYDYGDIDLYFHVFNASGAWYKENVLSCGSHVYNSEGVHIFNHTLNYSVKGEWELELKQEDLKAGGDYSYITYCNHSNSSGFISVGFKVRDQEQLINAIADLTNWFALLIGVIVIYFLIYLMTKIFHKIADKKEEKLNY